VHRQSNHQPHHLLSWQASAPDARAAGRLDRTLDPFVGPMLSPADSGRQLNGRAMYRLRLVRQRTDFYFNGAQRVWIDCCRGIETRYKHNRRLRPDRPRRAG
jgi:hypothetical protein